jgi:hypothetical protein
MNISHVRIELVLSWERTFLTRIAFAAVAAWGYAPELFCHFVDRVAMTK